MIPLTGEYALRVAVFLAAAGGGPTPGRTIAENTGIPTGYLGQVMAALGRQGIVKSRRGLHGGYSLAIPPETLSIYSVLAAVQAVPLNTASDPEAERGAVSGEVQHLLQEIGAQAEEALSKATIASLAKGLCPEAV